MASGTVTDLIVIGIIIVSGIFALSRGLVKELLSILSWVGAAFFTLYAFNPARPFMRELIPWSEIADIATGAALFLISLFAFWLIAHRLSRLVQISSAGALDRSLGFLFGIFRGLLIVVVLFMVVVWAVGTNQPNWMRAARTLPIINACAHILLTLVPDNMRVPLPRIKPAATPRSGGARPAPNERPGYGKAERRDMERLIQGTQ
jgi:membrane protein required for colicin V production